MLLKRVRTAINEFFEWDNITELVGLLLLVFLIRTFGFGLYQVPSGSMETTMLVGERFFADKFTYIFRNPKRGDILSLNDPTYSYSDNWYKRLFEEYVWGPSNWTKRVIGLPGDIVEGKIENGAPVVYLNGVKLDEHYLNKYPIISVWKQDKDEARSSAQAKVSRYVANRQINPTTAPLYVEELMRSSRRYESFDPNKAWNEQPFYRINPNLIYYNAEGKPEILYPHMPSTRHHMMHQERRGKSHWDGTDEFYVELGEGEYWCMGDNRLGSSDSRVFGPFNRRLIHGRILFRIWSIDSDESWWIVDLIKHPVDFWSRIRLDRFFQVMY